MVFQKNRRLYKLMWLPQESEIIFSLEDEKPVMSDSILYNLLAKYIDLNEWKNSYANLYNKWLNSDDDTIYRIEYPINMTMINALSQFNLHNSEYFLLYWFDIDRTFNDDYNWEVCPISGRELIDLGSEYPWVNSFISSENPLVFPRNIDSHIRNLQE